MKIALWIVTVASLFCSAAAQAQQRPNVLFIAIDDMNDWTEFLDGHPQAKTPNMAALARRSVNFTNAHCAAPACSPSRNALLFGVEPFHSGLYPFYDLDKVPEEVLAPFTSLPTLFRSNGYQTFGAGKIHHSSKQRPDEWTDYHQRSVHALHYNAAAGYQQGDSRKMAFCPTTDPVEVHPDYQVASYGIDVLGQQHDKPFFLAVGIVKPHLPFVCPQQFFDLYPEEVAAPRIKTDDLSDVPWAGRAMAKLNDDARYRKDQAWNRVRRAYLACISWVDFNVGRVLDALDESPYADNTIVVLWSDHGYHLGEKRSFRKFSLWEQATRVPLIIHDPRPQSEMSPGDCDAPVSLINLYRTLTDMTGIVPPDYVDGTSMVPLIRDRSASINRPAITTWGRGNYSARDQDWRYIRYFDGSEELYDHDSDGEEWTNLADDPAYVSEIKRLRSFLPRHEAPLVTEGISLWNVVDADQPKLGNAKKTYRSLNKNSPPLESSHP
ncbi:sulfatase [Rubripirellula lacrimiformis]|nr:sulfatase [Rubripirellula lacrimiformis]